MAVAGSYYVSSTSGNGTAYWSSFAVGTNFVAFIATFTNNSSTNTHYWEISSASGGYYNGLNGFRASSSPVNFNSGFGGLAENTTYTVTATKYGPSLGVLASQTITFTTGYSEFTLWTDNTISSSATKGVAYSDSVSAGNSPTYTVLSSTPHPDGLTTPTGYTLGLPPGITHNGSGGISGTPNTVGNYAFYVRAVKDNTIYTGWLLINVADPAPAWSDQTLADQLRLNVSYSDAVSATNSPTYSIDTVAESPTNLYLFLPGVYLNKTTGAVSGTPTQQGTFIKTIRASNAGGAITKSFTLYVNPVGKRFTGSSSSSTLTTLKRYDPAASPSPWVFVNTIKRYNGTSWENIDNF
jgi:hypothetical protein